MKKSPLFQLMDDFTNLLDSEAVENAANALISRAAIETPALSIEALARLLAIEVARRKGAEARLKRIASEEREI